MEELTVEDIMTPHAEIIGIDITQSFEAAQKIIGSSYYSRLPVFQESIDQVYRYVASKGFTSIHGSFRSRTVM